MAHLSTHILYGLTHILFIPLAGIFSIQSNPGLEAHSRSLLVY